MKTAKVIRKNDNQEIVAKCLVTQNSWERFVGLLGKDSLSENEGLWITPCNSIHTYFMKFSIDVVYLDKSGRVLEIHQNVKPWVMHWPRFDARAVLELPTGCSKNLRLGDELCTV